jgi:hypothetical protein
LNCRPLPYQGSALPLSYGSRGRRCPAPEARGNCHKGWQGARKVPEAPRGAFRATGGTDPLRDPRSRNDPKCAPRPERNQRFPTLHGGCSSKNRWRTAKNLGGGSVAGGRCLLLSLMPALHFAARGSGHQPSLPAPPLLHPPLLGLPCRASSLKPRHDPSTVRGGTGAARSGAAREPCAAQGPVASATGWSCTGARRGAIGGCRSHRGARRDRRGGRGVVPWFRRRRPRRQKRRQAKRLRLDGRLVPSRPVARLTQCTDEMDTPAVIAEIEPAISFTRHGRAPISGMAGSSRAMTHSVNPKTRFR